MERFLELWGKMPTTQARVSITLFCVIATALRYTLSELQTMPDGVVRMFWQPSYEWLGFLLLMSGVDAAQFYVKRTTDNAFMASKMGAAPAAPTSEAKG